jgi:dienelactone hydrolase
MDAVESEAAALLPCARWAPRGFVATSARDRLRAFGPSGFSGSDPHRRERAGGGRGQSSGCGRIDPGLPRDAGKGRTVPTVLVVQEIFGVHEHIKDICRRLAKLGYFAIAPELYARQGNPAEISDIQELVAKIVSKVPDVEQMSDLDATVAFAKASGAADTSKLAITGLCRGGRTVWLYAAHNPAVKAAVSSYGHLELPSSELQPKSPIDLAADLKAPPRPLWRRRHRHQGPRASRR